MPCVMAHSGFMPDTSNVGEHIERHAGASRIPLQKPAFH